MGELVASGTGVIRRPQRPRELQDPLNFYLYHPLAWRLAERLSTTPVTPNMVSVIGGLFVVAAAFAYAQPWWPWSALLGMLLHMTWHVVDGADGDLARITGKASPIGEMVDGLCDYSSHVVLYLVLGWLLDRQIGHVAWLCAVAAGASHIVQANHVEVQRRQYQWWVYGVPWIRHSHAAADSKTRNSTFGALVSAYLGLAMGMTPYARRVDLAVEQAAGDPARMEAIRRAVRAEAPPLLLILKFLGPNPRAIVLGLAMLAGSPIYYFAYQTLVLNMLLVASVVMHNRSAERIGLAV